VSMLVDKTAAEMIQLRLEYNPAPPFTSGSPDTAPAGVLASMHAKIVPAQARRLEAVKQAARRLV
jgi:cyclohexyl-isocyanide hydratase